MILLNSRSCFSSALDLVWSYQIRSSPTRSRLSSAKYCFQICTLATRVKDLSNWKFYQGPPWCHQVLPRFHKVLSWQCLLILKNSATTLLQSGPSPARSLTRSYLNLATILLSRYSFLVLADPSTVLFQFCHDSATDCFGPTRYVLVFLGPAWSYEVSFLNLCAYSHSVKDLLG